MSERLAGKTAVITGAGSGVGRATAEVFHREGANVILGDITGAEQDLAQELGERAVGVAADMSDAAQVNELIAAASERFGSLDVLANCAGVDGELAPAAQMSEDNVRRVMDVNYMGPFFAMRAAIPIMLAGGGGSIINVSSASTEKAFPYLGAYAASKAALNALTRAFGVELAAQGIRVNALSPGVIDTPLSRALPPEMFEGAVQGVPIKRPATTADIANALLWLASDESTYVTTSVLAIDGGMSVS